MSVNPFRNVNPFSRFFDDNAVDDILCVRVFKDYDVQDNISNLLFLDKVIFNKESFINFTEMWKKVARLNIDNKNLITQLCYIADENQDGKLSKQEIKKIIFCINMFLKRKFPKDILNNFFENTFRFTNEINYMDFQMMLPRLITSEEDKFKLKIAMNIITKVFFNLNNYQKIK